MTSTVMLAAVRTILAESTAGFFTDAEIYTALADGQTEVIKYLIDIYRAKRRIDSKTPLFYELESILNDDTGTTQSVAVPSGFLELISATFDHNGTGGENPCNIVNMNVLPFYENNTYLSATDVSPRVYIKSISDVVTIVFLPTLSGTPAYTIHYLKSPTDIASGQNAVLPVTTHNAIVYFTVSRMLSKEQRLQEAQIYLQNFMNELKGMA